MNETRFKNLLPFSQKWDPTSSKKNVRKVKSKAHNLFPSLSLHTHTFQTVEKPNFLFFSNPTKTKNLLIIISFKQKTQHQQQNRASSSFNNGSQIRPSHPNPSPLPLHRPQISPSPPELRCRSPHFSPAHTGAFFHGKRAKVQGLCRAQRIQTPLEKRHVPGQRTAGKVHAAGEEAS